MTLRSWGLASWKSAKGIWIYHPARQPHGHLSEDGKQDIPNLNYFCNLNTRNEQNKAVVTSLRSLAKHFGAQNLTVMVDNTLSCEALPAFLSGTQCLGVEHCRDETFHSPTMGCVFSSFLSAREHARNDIIGFINGDILIFFIHFASFLRYLWMIFGPYLVICGPYLVIWQGSSNDDHVLGQF